MIVAARLALLYCGNPSESVVGSIASPDLGGWDA